MPAPRELSPIVAGIAAGVLYGVLSRMVFGGTGVEYFGVMTFSFLFLVPMGLGALTVYLAPPAQRVSWAYAVFVPWVTALLCLGTAFLVHLEGMICVVLMFPAAMLMSSLGGAAMCAGIHFSERRARGRLQSGALAALLLLPFVASPLEKRLGLPHTERVVDTRIRIRADAETVWRNIERVPMILPGEQTPSLAHRIGFPKPLEATLSHEGVGGVRHASFERGVVFVETVTEWERLRRLSFTIESDPESIPQKALDEHVTVGGPFFDVLTGTYEIEPAGPGEVVLHLSSTHRLSTTFNPYARLWTDWIMRDVQENILNVIKRRCEAEAAGRTAAR